MCVCVHVSVREGVNVRACSSDDVIVRAIQCTSCLCVAIGMNMCKDLLHFFYNLVSLAHLNIWVDRFLDCAVQYCNTIRVAI